MTRCKRSKDGFYYIKGEKYKKCTGSRAEVWHKTAYKTSGGLTRDKLVYNKHGRIVSRVKHSTEKRDSNLKKYGYSAKKGKFGAVRCEPTRRKSTRKSRRSTKKKANTA